MQKHGSDSMTLIANVGGKYGHLLTKITPFISCKSKPKVRSGCVKWLSHHISIVAHTNALRFLYNINKHGIGVQESLDLFPSRKGKTDISFCSHFNTLVRGYDHAKFQYGLQRILVLPEYHSGQWEKTILDLQWKQVLTPEQDLWEFLAIDLVVHDC